MAALQAFPDKARVLKLAEQIQTRLAHAQQLKLSGQQPVNTQGHVIQAEEIQRRLTEAVLRLQDAARDYTLQGVSKRLEIISRKLNLLFDIQSTSQATACFLSCADFYLEVGFHDNRLISSVKLVHTHLSPREPLILDTVLSDHTFSRLESHLSGLLQVYTQAEGQERGQVFQALSATESVLISINQHSQSSSLHDTIMTQPLGLLTPRDGGLPMKLTYFQHPHEALTTPLSPNHVTSRDQEVGVSATVLVEKSSQTFLLSLDPNLFSFEKQGFHPVTSSNGVSLSVTFVLQHLTPIPVCAATMNNIHSIVFVQSQVPPFSGIHINALIAKSEAEKAKKEVCTDEYHVVPLPSQCHYYRVPPELSTPSPPHLSSSSSPETGTSLSVVPFLHPGSVVPLVKLLRKQLVYNCLLSSVLSRTSLTAAMATDHTHSHDYVFEFSTEPPNLLSVSLNIGRISDDVIVFEFSVEPLSVTLRMGMSQTISKELSKVVARCLSIPITLYAALKKPDSILGPKVTSLIKAHHKEMYHFMTKSFA